MNKKLEKLFDEEFVRDDGLMDKYHGEEFTAKAIKAFIDKNFIDRRELEARIDAINRDATFHIREIPKKILLAGDLKEDLLGKEKNI